MNNIFDGHEKDTAKTAAEKLGITPKDILKKAGFEIADTLEFIKGEKWGLDKKTLNNHSLWKNNIAAEKIEIGMRTRHFNVGEYICGIITNIDGNQVTIQIQDGCKLTLNGNSFTELSIDVLTTDIGELIDYNPLEGKDLGPKVPIETLRIKEKDGEIYLAEKEYIEKEEWVLDQQIMEDGDLWDNHFKPNAVKIGMRTRHNSAGFRLCGLIIGFETNGAIIKVEGRYNLHIKPESMQDLNIDLYKPDLIGQSQ